MKSVLLVLKVHLKSAFSALRNDTRTKIAWFFALGLDCVLGFWSINQLLTHIYQWQMIGTAVLASHLWLLFSGIWVGIALFAALSTMTLGFGGNQVRLLMTLPISQANRFRALYGLLIFAGIGNWLVLAVLVIGIPLIIVLGLEAIKWLPLLLLGVTISVLITLVVMLVVFRYVLPNLKKTFLVIVVTCTGIGIAYIALRFVGFTTRLPALSMPPAIAMSLLFLLVVLLIVGPFAGFTGKLYEEAFHEMEGRSRSRIVMNVPGVHFLIRLLRRYRNLTGALLIRGLLNQSRNVYTWGRVVIILICIALFPLIRTQLTPFGFSRMLLAVVYASGVAILAVIDYAPYAISSEGSRLMYYLVAPSGIKAYLRSRLMLLSIAALIVGLAICLVMSWWVGLSMIEFVQTGTMVILIVIAYTSFCVCGSTWDADLNLVSEGMMPVISQEELPFTPRRLQLLSMSFLLLGMMFLMVWKLPVPLSLSLLILLDVIVLMLGWNFSHAQIRGLINRG